MTDTRVHPGRGVLALLLVVLLVVVLFDLTQLNDDGGDSRITVEPLAPPVAAPPTSAAWFGLLEAGDTQLSSLHHARDVSDIAVAASWAAIQPTRDGYSDAADARLRDRVREVGALGYRVVLDFGLQYPPSWVFDLPGQTRFVNQFGDTWHGALSTDVPNSVFNPHVRAAVGAYVTHLGRVLHGLPVDRVRIGGLLSGELRYPPQNYAGHSNLIWNYDDVAQADAAVPGWRPGDGSAADARTALTGYFDSLTGYLVWLMGRAHRAFPAQREEVLLPSWGLRPGMVDAAIASGLRNTTNAEVNGMISSGLDWAGQVAAVARTQIPAYVSSTWLDAPQEGDSVQQIAPIAYLVRLGARYGLPVAGENTGRGGKAALDLSVERVRRYGLAGMMYMSGRLVADGRAGVTLPELLTEAAEVRRR